MFPRKTNTLTDPISSLILENERLMQTLHEAAKQAVEQIGPRVWRVIGLKDPNNPVFLVIGCHGSGKKPQEQIAASMNEIASYSKHEPDFVVGLGDAGYDYGMSSPSDPLFQQCHYNKYCKDELPHIKDKSFFMSLGNHDGNRHKKAIFSANPIGRATEINQAAHTYMPDEKFQSVEDKIKLYSQEELKLKDLSSWVMPYFYYSIIAGSIQIFLVNSNSFLKDYLDLFTHKEQDQFNQAKWLQNEFEKAKAANRTIFVAMHHPIYTEGKRAFEKNYDTSHYLNQADVDILQEILQTNTSSYNELLALCFDQLNIRPDAFLTAHDHNLNFYNNRLFENKKNFMQIGCGAGGGDLQKRKKFDGQKFSGLYLSEYGCVLITCRQIPKIHYYTLKNHHVKFTLLSHEPSRKMNQDNRVEAFRTEVIKACNNFFEEQARLQKVQIQKEKEENIKWRGYLWNNVKHNAAKAVEYLMSYEVNDVDRVHDIMAYLNQPKLPIYETVLSEIKDRMNKMEDHSSNESLFVIFKKMNPKIYDTLFFPESLLSMLK